MKVPAIPVAGMMIVVALAALDLAALLARRSPERELILWLLPTLNAVLLGLAILLRRAVRRDRPSPFWVGFVAAGTFASGLLILAWLSFPFELGAFSRAGARYLERFWDDYIKITGGFTTAYWLEIDQTFRWVVMAVLPITFAVLGGWLARRLSPVSTLGSLDPEESGASAEGPDAGPTGRSRAIRIRRTLIALTASVLFVQACGIAILNRWRGEYLSEARKYRSFERAHDQLARELVRSARLWEEGHRPLVEAVPDEAARRFEAEKLRTQAEQHRGEASRYSRLWQKYEVAARRPWLRVSPDPPPR